MADWVVDRTEEPGEEEAFAPLKFEIINYPADITLRGYHDQWKSGQLVVPEFQREYVWDVKKASKLIESFLLGLPVPGVFLYKTKVGNKLQIIDGQQRILSSIKYLDDKFDDNTFFRLKGVNDHEGERFSDLPPDQKFKLETTVLRATIIQQLSPDDDTSVYQIFERLNTGGVNLNPMEIRQSVSFGPFVALIKDLNTTKSWRELLGMPKPDKRLRDVELILRILALFERRAEYEKPMKEFLNQYMEHKRRHLENYDGLGSAFQQSVEEVRAALGPKPFHLRGRLNYGVLDSVMVAALTNGVSGDLKEKLAALVQDPVYLNAVTYNTSDASAIDTRMDLAIAALS